MSATAAAFSQTTSQRRKGKAIEKKRRRVVHVKEQSIEICPDFLLLL